MRVNQKSQMHPGKTATSFSPLRQQPCPYMRVMQKKKWQTDIPNLSSLLSHALDALFICVPIWRNPPNLPASPQKKQRERERVKGGGGGECRKKRTRKKLGEREVGGNTRTKEQVRHTQKSGNQLLGCSGGKHPNQISNDPGRLLPICFDIPQPCPARRVQIKDDSCAKDS